MLDESLYELRVALLVLRVLGLLDLEPQELILLLHRLCVVHAIPQLSSHLEVLRRHVPHFHLQMVSLMGRCLVFLTQVLQLLHQVGLHFLRLLAESVQLTLKVTHFCLKRRVFVLILLDLAMHS